MPSPLPPPPTAASLLRDVGLLADGPLPWGRQIPARGPGVYVIELAAPLVTAPIELTRVGKWLERVPDLLLDGHRPSSRALAARLASFWLPGQVVLYIGASSGSLGGRLAAMDKTALGDRRPAASGYWLKTLRENVALRVWWAPTDGRRGVRGRAARGVRGRRVGGRTVRARRRDDRARSCRSRPCAARPASAGGPASAIRCCPSRWSRRAPPTRVVAAARRRCRRCARRARGEGRARRVIAQPAPAPIRRAPRAATAKRPADNAQTAPDRRGRGPTAGGAARADRASAGRRSIARIRAAKELGDLKENADYTAAREEQSFLEGRVQALEARLRDAVVVERAGGRRRGGPGLDG